MFVILTYPCNRVIYDLRILLNTCRYIRMTPLDYVSSILSKMRHKKYEYYVLSRFWHRLDDLTIEISPQQYIARENGFALADLYLPQFNLVVEVDESHHMNLENLSSDQVREKDIIKAINADIYRIPIYSIDQDSGRIKQKSNRCH